MSKITVNTNYRVVIDADAGYAARWKQGWLEKLRAEEKECKGDAERMKDEVRRHVDGGEGARVEFDVEPMCGHCGAAWTEDSPDYNGGCCGKDEGAQDQRIADAAITAQDNA